MYNKGRDIMKKEINILRLFLVAVAVIIIGLCLFFACNRVDYDELTEVRIKVMGSLIMGGEEYTLSTVNGSWVAGWNQYEWGVENERQMVVDESFVSEIKQILKDEKAHKWNDYDFAIKIEELIAAITTDGGSYSFYMSFSDGTVIEFDKRAHPKTFFAVLNAFEERYMTLFVE